ncbi:hypothetical protein ACFL02_03010 [Planctomycetota bacterium]
MNRVNIILFFVFFVLWALLGGCGGPSSFVGRGYEAAPPVRIDELPTELAAVQEKLDESQPGKAVKLVNKWIKENEDSEFMDRALFLKGEALFEKKSYLKAYESYEELLDGYSTSRFFEPALHKEMEIAHQFLTGVRRKLWGFIPIRAYSEAVEILDGIVEHWPLSELSAEALMMQADFFFNEGRFLEAQGTYLLLVEHYGKSRYFESALLGGAESSQAQYEGSFYDGGCLMEARYQYERYQALYPARADQLGIGQRIERIDWQEGERSYKTADYYQRTDRREAACFYFDYITQRWPGSVWARRSEESLQARER